MKKKGILLIATSLLASTVFLGSLTGKADAAQLHLPSDNPTWTVYKMGHPLLKSNPANIAGTLAPSRYGGLTYDILGTVGPNSYIINTQSFGQVEIYAGLDTDAQVIGSLPTTVSTSKPVSSTTSSTSKKLILPASSTSWTVYKIGHPLLKSNPANVAGTLTPSLYGGLTYDILGTVGPNSYIINTQSFGQVEIYAGPETGAKIISGTQSTSSPTPNPVTTTSPTTTTTTNNIYIIQKGDTLYSIALKFKTSVNTLKSLNALTSDIIFIGQKLNVTGSISTPAPTPLPLTGKVIVLDAGHGGSDAGSIAIDGSYEKTYTLNYATDVKNDLQSLGATVYMTRTSDTRCGGVWDEGTNADLQCRVNVASNVHANIFVSIHMNWTPGATGSTTYYNETNTYDGNVNPYPVQSKELATYIQNSYQPVIGLSNRGVQNADYYVNRMAKMPSVLLEVGFISNPNDLSLIKSKEQITAKAIADGIVKYFANVN